MKPSEPAAALTPAVAAAIASSAWVLPAVMSLGANPGPTNPGTFLWYSSLRQPPWKPPDALIPIAWTLLETGLAVSAYRLLRAKPSPARTRALGLLGYCVAMIGGWSRLFFKHRNLPVCIAASSTMIAAGAAYTVTAREVDRPAAAAGVPFTAWVGFATLLTWSIWRLNRR